MSKISAEDMVKMGLGALLITKEKVEKLIDEAIKQGNISKDEGTELLNNLKNKVEVKKASTGKMVQEEIHKQLKNLGIATKEDLAALRHEITALKHEMQK